jgi:hypothetical protein
MVDRYGTFKTSNLVGARSIDGSGFCSLTHVEATKRASQVTAQHVTVATGEAHSEFKFSGVKVRT